jgi:hypothetical protein
MRNDLEYDYHPLGVPNVLQQVKKKEVREVIHCGLKDLITTVAIKHPRWTLIFDRIKRCNIYENQEKLGDVSIMSTWTMTRGSHEVFQIKNLRVSSKLERKEAMHTVDAKRAIKLINKHFGVKSPVEVIADVGPEALSKLADLESRASHNYIVMKRTMYGYLDKYVAEHFLEVADAAMAAGCKEDLSELPKLGNKADKLKHMEASVSAGHAKIIVVYNNDYIAECVPSKTNSHSGWAKQISAMAPITVSDKTNVGMLKLIKPGEYIPDIGVRVSRDAFLVLTKQEKENE